MTQDDGHERVNVTVEVLERRQQDDLQADAGGARGHQ